MLSEKLWYNKEFIDELFNEIKKSNTTDGLKLTTPTLDYWFRQLESHGIYTVKRGLQNRIVYNKNDLLIARWLFESTKLKRERIRSVIFELGRYCRKVAKESGKTENRNTLSSSKEYEEILIEGLKDTYFERDKKKKNNEDTNKGDEELELRLLNKEYDKTVIKGELLNIAIQLMSDNVYTKEMAANEIVEVSKRIERVMGEN